MSLLLAGHLPNYESKEVTFAPAPLEQTHPWNPAFKPKATVKTSSPTSSAPSKPKRVRGPRGKRRIAMPSSCWVPGCAGNMRVGRGGMAAGFCAQHWRALPRGLRIELLLARLSGRVRMARFELYLKQAGTVLGVTLRSLSEDSGA